MIKGHIEQSLSSAAETTECTPSDSEQRDVLPTGSDIDEHRNQDVGLRELRSTLQQFRHDRNWAVHHTPRNLLLALVGEVGELSEIFQWRPDADCTPGLRGWMDIDRVHLGEELADVLLYLVQLADVCDIDLPVAVTRKIGLNAVKYPALN